MNDAATAAAARITAELRRSLSTLIMADELAAIDDFLPALQLRRHELLRNLYPFSQVVDESEESNG